MNTRHNKFFAPVLILILVIYTILIMVVIAYAETAVAIKQGYTVYDENRESKYPGNNVFDSEFTKLGGFLRYTKDGFIYRLDIDGLKTGNTFSHHLPIPYEQVDMEFNPVIFSIGRSFWNFYGLLGAGYSFNSAEIEGYSAYPISCDLKNSLAFTGTIGYEQPIGDWFTFGEFRYMHSETDVIINGSKVFTEDISNKEFCVGVGYEW